MSAEPTIHFVGEIESPRPLRATAGLIAVRGWCLIAGQPEPPPVRLVTAAGILPLSTRVVRPDVRQLLAIEPAAETSGFVIAGRLQAGVHLARFEACAPDGSWRAFKTLTLHVTPPPFTAAVETPAVNGTFADRIHLDGWAVHPAQAVKTLVLRYGHQEIPCELGKLRPDLAAQFPASTGSAKAGFRSVTNLSAGRGPLRLKATFADGSCAVASTSLSVNVAVDENHGPELELAADRISLPRSAPRPSPATPRTTDHAPLHILFVLPGSFAANSALHAAALANALTRAGHTCAIAVSHDVATLAHHETPLFTGITHADARRGLAFPDGLPPDIIHAWTTRENVRLLVTELRASTPRLPRVIVHLEDNEFQLLAFTLGRTPTELLSLPESDLARLVPPDLSHPNRSREFLAQADGVTVITDRLREFVPAGLPCHTLWPAADERFFFAHSKPTAFRTILDRRPGETVLFYHGNIHAANVAEVAELYRAVVDLNALGHPTTLIRTGLNSATLPNDLVGAVTGHVLELGQILHHQHLPPLLALADFFVQPGSPDAFNDYRFPSKLPEFFAIGRPVILPRTNLGERVRHGIDAYVLDRADAASIASAIIALRQDPDLCAQLSRGALAFAREHFSWARSAAELAGFYHTIARA